MKETIDKFQGLADYIKPGLLSEQSMYRAGKMQGMIDAYEYCVEHLKDQYPPWTIWVKDIIVIICGAILGIALALAYQLN